MVAFLQNQDKLVSRKSNSIVPVIPIGHHDVSIQHSGSPFSPGDPERHVLLVPQTRRQGYLNVVYLETYSS